MSNFTDAELEAAVAAFVRDEVKSERTDLGPFSVDYTFGESREFVASTLIYDPSAIFYLLSLAANRVNQDVELALEYLDDIIEGIEEMGRRTVKVTQTGLLEDAAAALLEVERIIDRSNAVTERPFTRYERALDRFTDNSLTPNVRRLTGSGFPTTYEIVRPPQKAQSTIRTNISALSTVHSNIIEEANQLTESMSEFMAADLPLLAIKLAVQNVRNDLRGLKEELDGSSDDGAIELTRDAFLRVQAGRAVVTNLTSITDPRNERMKSTATSTDRMVAVSPSSEATPAQISCSLSAPYLITPSNDELNIGVDGGSTSLVTLVPKDPASITALQGETYDIHTAQAASLTSSSAGPYTVPSAPNNVFNVFVDGTGYQATLTSGSRTAAQLVPEINAATRIDGAAGTFGAVATASDSSGTLKLTHDTVGAGSIVIGNQTSLNTALGFTDDQSSDDSTSTRGVDDNTAIRFLVDDINFVTATLNTGTARTAAQVASDIAGASSLIDAAEETVTIEGGTEKVVKVSSKSYGDGSYIGMAPSSDVHREAMSTLGFFEGEEDRSDYFSLKDLEDALASISGIETERSEEVVASGSNGTAVLDGSDYKLRLPGGTLGVIPTTSDMLWISNGPNAGWYQITAVTTLGGDEDIWLGRPLQVTSGDEAQNQSWEVHRKILTILSEDETTASALQIAVGSANSALGLSVQTEYGSVSGIKVQDGSVFLNFTRNDVRVGDFVTLRGPTYTTEHTVAEVSEDGYQVEVTPQVKNDMAGTGQEYIVESSGARAYASFITELGEWIEVLQSSRFEEDVQELVRVLNPLLTSKNPSASSIGTAKNAALDLRALYTGSSPRGISEILEEFVVLPVARIDAILNMLKERGLDRAYDLLLLGRIEDFFAATKDNASYGGNLLEKMRAIAQNDVPVGRGTDEENVDSRELASFDDPDADYDFSDQDDERGMLEVDDIPDLDPEEDILNRSY
jgi:hypothetical protein